MSEKIVQITELPSYIDELCERLKEMGYADSSIKSHRGILYKFCRYAEKMQFKTFDFFAVQQFIIAYNGDDYDNKYHSYRYNRPFAMLATAMLENNVPVNVIAQTLGHSDLNSVGNYIRISTKLLKKCAMEVTDYE